MPHESWTELPKTREQKWNKLFKQNNFVTYFSPIFQKQEKKFYLYALYNKNKPNSDSLMAEYGSIFFKAKQLELGDKMDLASYLLKPVQRMGKYALLLQQLVKAGTDLSEQLTGNKNDKDDKDDDSKPAFEGEADLRLAEQMVRFQLRHGNDLLAMDSLRDCDVSCSF